MSTPSARALSVGLLVLVGAATTVAACDTGDDTVYPTPFPLGSDGGAAGNGNAGANAGGSSLGKAGTSGGLGGGAGTGAIGAGASGTAGTSGAAGASGFGGAAGLGGSSASGGTAGLAGAAGAAGFGGAAVFGGNAGSAGGGGATGGAGGGGVTGGAGGAGGAALSPYGAACASLADKLATCGATAASNDTKQQCVPSQACAEKLYVDGAPSKVLGCLEAACSLPAVLPSATDACLEQAGTAASLAARQKFKKAVESKASFCGFSATEKEAGKVLASMGDVHGFYRAAIFNELTDCVEGLSGPLDSCSKAVACLKDVLASTCPATKGSISWIWPTDAVITNAVLKN